MHERKSRRGWVTWANAMRIAWSMTDGTKTSADRVLFSSPKWNERFRAAAMILSCRVGALPVVVIVGGVIIIAGRHTTTPISPFTGMKCARVTSTGIRHRQCVDFTWNQQRNAIAITKRMHELVAHNVSRVLWFCYLFFRCFASSFIWKVLFRFYYLLYFLFTFRSIRRFNTNVCTANTHTHLCTEPQRAMHLMNR